MAGLTTTQTFSDGDTVTAAKLNNIIANASISDGGIAPDKLAPNSVKEANMANNSVDTNALVSDSVTNSKLDTMEKRRVKVNATDATANPTDLFVDANQLLVGTSSTINAVSFSDDLALDNAGATASKIIAAPSLINGKSTVAASNLDELLLYDQDATTVLKKTTAGSIVASLKATTSQAGSILVASGSAVSDPLNATVVEEAFTPTQAINCPIFAKAWASISSNLNYEAGIGKFSLDSSYNIGTEQSSGTLTSATKYKIIEYKSGDNFTTVGASSNATGVQFTATGTSPTWSNGSRLVPVPIVASRGVVDFTFSDAVPSDNFIVLVSNAKYGNGSVITEAGRATVSNESTGGFRVTFHEIDDGDDTLNTPMVATILVFGT